MLNYYAKFNNGISSDIGLAIEHRPIIPAPERTIEYYEVEGRDGNLSRKKGYKDIQIPVEFACKSNNLPQLGRNAKAWLLNYSDNKLSFCDDLDFFYKVKKVKCGDIARSLKVFGRFTAEFTCDPFQYSYDGENIITYTASGGIITNPGSIYSQPKIRIYGSGDVIVNIGDTVFQITGLNEYIDIDSELNDVYKGSILCTNQKYGYFPLIQPGNNGINWTGNITKIEVTPHWRWL
jgi:predicted phage tail component-like protein